MGCSRALLMDGQVLASGMSSSPWRKPVPCPDAWELGPTQALLRAVPTCQGMPWAAALTARAATGATELRDPAALIRFSFVLDPSNTRSGAASTGALQRSWPRKQPNGCPFASPAFKTEKTESDAFFHKISKCSKAVCCTAAQDSPAGVPSGGDVAVVAPLLEPHAICRQRSRPRCLHSLWHWGGQGNSFNHSHILSTGRLVWKMMSKTTVSLSKPAADSFKITYALFKKEPFSVACFMPLSSWQTY